MGIKNFFHTRKGGPSSENENKRMRNKYIHEKKEQKNQKQLSKTNVAKTAEQGCKCKKGFAR
jgi:hypothetical protein